MIVDNREASGIEPYAQERFGLGAEHISGVDDWRVEDLVRPGLRRNPKRAHLWVSTVLGKHIPVPPAVIFAAAADLGVLSTTALRARGLTDSLVFGFAETATGLGHAVAHQMDAGHYLQSTRRENIAVPVIARFEEGHSHATDHLIVPTDPDTLLTDLPVVLVDDEISTGATALDAIASMQRIHRRPLYLVSSLVDMRTEDDISRCRRRAEELGTEVEFISLARGCTHIPEGLPAQVVDLPPATPPPSVAQAGSIERLEVPWPASVPDGGRHGFRREDWPDFDEAISEVARVVAGRLDPGRSIVVVGHEELMYLPQRVAASLAEFVEAPILSQTTTRSPAHVIDREGYPLRRGYNFIAPEPDEARDRYLYNAVHDDPDARVVMIVDSPADTESLTGSGGLVDTLSGAGVDVLLVVVPGTDFGALRAARETL
jgi:orotate phosphoribosyltransferase